MSELQIYFQIGYHHIVNREALDHILFIIALSLRYQLGDWKKLILLVTAFTIGHTVTLTLSVFDVVDLSRKWIEFFIPVTILITAVSNLFVKTFIFKAKFPFIYFMALFFGLIHGLGFSNDLKSLIGSDNHLVIKLLAANFGIEAGQLLFVAGIPLFSLLLVSLLKVNRREYLIFVSAGIFTLAAQMAFERIPW
jgi:hypothetical protein